MHKLRKLSDLVLLENNPRTIKDKDFDRLVKSIKENKEYFNARPLILSDRTGQLVVIAGNQRYRAAEKLGLKEVPTYLIKDLTEEKEREIIIRDNVSNGEWNFDVLANEWDAIELEEWGVEIPEMKIDNILTEDDDFEIGSIGDKKTDIVLGDLFEIGPHKLLCGDSTDSDQVSKLMNGSKADMVFTDPPYNINYGNIKRPKFKQREIENDNMSAGDFKDFCKGFISNIVLFNKGCVYMAGPPGPDGRIMFIEADNVMHCSTVIIWNKDQFTLGRGKYQNKYEPIWFGWVDKGTSFYGDRTQTNVWDIARPKKSEEHPTMKPIELCAKGIEHASRKDDTVMDLFLGSGTTMVAAHQLNRKCYGMELDPKYCQVIIDRMRKLDPDLVIKKNGLEI